MTKKYREEIPLRVCDLVFKGLTGCAVNLTNCYGLDEKGHCERSKNGFSMWLLQNASETPSLVFDAGDILPFGELHIWNYNRIDPDQGNKDYTLCGLKEVQVFTSVDRINWREAKSAGYPFTLKKASGTEGMPATNLADGRPIDLEGVTARYLKIQFVAKPGSGNFDTENAFGASFGLAKLRLHTGRGLAVARDDAWTAAFQCRNGWAGADGIYSVPLDGAKYLPTQANTFFTFGDTLIGGEKDGVRTAADMVNSSVAAMRGSDPHKIDFAFGEKNGRPKDAFPVSAQLKQMFGDDAFFWMQDSVVINGKVYCFPLVMAEDLSEPEGYQFKILGTALITSAIKDGEVDWQNASQGGFALHYEMEEKKALVFGGAIFPNTAAAGAPCPDGYIYIYGHKPRFFSEDLYVCRVKEEDIADISKYRFYDGESWGGDIAKSQQICENVSCEFSVSPYFGRLYEGKYIMVFQDYVNSPTVCCRIADTPVGPFSEARALYSCPEVAKGCAVYTYNAKAHPHITPGEGLLVSYNVNTCNWEMNMQDATIYSPRFLRLNEIF